MDSQTPLTPVNDMTKSADLGSSNSSSDKQEIVDYLKNAKNVLVTVSSSPSVDELAGALGLTFLLSRLDKHPTTVFSGKIPAAMEFLDPEKTFENNVDSLRDFIIALDKEKADKLRYKVEDDVVKIYITPYKTTLKKDDFEFSQGDFNVDVVVALGVSKRDDLDKAIISHGRILHDATVISINTKQGSALGVLDLVEQSASSISEIIVGMAESLGDSLLDDQSSTALLTGIVAATNRFSNEKTSPKVMTMAAQLMASGANQQLIASNLKHEGIISEEIHKASKVSDKSKDDGELSLRHDDKKSSHSENKQPKSSSGDNNQNSALSTEPKTKPAPETEVEPVIETSDRRPQAVSSPQTMIKRDELRVGTEKPNFGGTLSATTNIAEQTKAQELQREAEHNKLALSHDAPNQEAGHKEDAIAAARAAVEKVSSAGFDNVDRPEAAVNQDLPAVSETQTETSASLSPIDPSAFKRQEVPHPGSAAPRQMASSLPAPDPMDSFMNAHDEGLRPPEGQLTNPFDVATLPTLAANLPTQSALPNPPSLPPLPPPLPSDGSLPPLPPGAANPFQPQTSPEFIQDTAQSQNPWTEAGQDLANRQAASDEIRQGKMNHMAQQYDAAVDKNRELQGLPPVNNPNDHSVFPLPPQK